MRVPAGQYIPAYNLAYIRDGETETVCIIPCCRSQSSSRGIKPPSFIIPCKISSTSPDWENLNRPVPCQNSVSLYNSAIWGRCSKYSGSLETAVGVLSNFILPISSTINLALLLRGFSTDIHKS